MQSRKAAFKERMLYRWPAVLVIMAFSPLGAQTAQQSPVRLDRQVTVFLPKGEPAAVVRAAGDLLSDLTKVFGSGPRLIDDEGDAGPVEIVVGSTTKTLPGEKTPNAESFSIVTKQKSGTQVEVRLTGADMRGTMYAIYQFSEEFLGIDPMAYWTDHVPQQRDSIALPLPLNRRYPSPVFRYRGIFINDEDLLTGWAPGEAKDKTGISLAVWDKIFETVLRLKGNMIVPGTFPFSGEPQELAAAGRGLILHQHHAEPLGVDVARWPKNVPYNYTEHPEILRNAWRHSVAALPADQEVLWTVGLRGLSDQSYAELDPSVMGKPEAQGRIIRQAIDDEMRIVRAVQPNAVFAANVWSEGAKLLHDSFLKLPPEVIANWPDTGYSDMQDKGQLQPGQGAYVHVAMMNRRANQLTELVSADKLYAEMTRYQNAGATGFLLVNTSDIRPVTMGTQAIMNFAWKGQATGSASDFYQSWAARQFGPKAANEVAGIYQEYFAAPGLRSDLPLPVGDQYYHTQARDILLPTMVQYPLRILPSQAPTWTIPKPYIGVGVVGDALENAKAEVQRCSEAEARWDHVWNRALAAQPFVDPLRRDFYQAQVLTMIAINRESNLMLLEVARAVVAFHAGEKDATTTLLTAALAAIGRLRAQEHAAEYGQWKDWYAGDWLTNVVDTEKMITQFAAWVKDPESQLPAPIVTPQWQAYYHILHYQGTREVEVQ